MKSITVLVITYNQEDVISRCLDSILVQKDFGLKHIVVCDDCSKDRTWEVLQSYVEKYPHIVRAYRNETNLGIYPNSQKAVSLRGEADLFTQLAGDDALCDGWFEQVQNLIVKENVDFNIPIGIYSDWKYVLIDGREIVERQDLVTCDCSLFSLYIRGKAINRSLFVNNEVISKYSPIILDKGLNLTESYFDSQDSRLINKAYYLPYVGSIYYSGRGVSIGLGINKSDYYTTQAIEKWEYFIEHYINTEQDLFFAKYGIELANYYMTPTVKGLYHTCLLYYKGRLNCLNYGLGHYWKQFTPLLKFLIKQIWVRE